IPTFARMTAPGLLRLIAKSPPSRQAFISSRHVLPVAMLELLAGTAGTGLIAAHAAPSGGVVRIAPSARGRVDGRCGKAQGRACAEGRALRHVELVLAGSGIEMLREHGRQRLRLGLLEYDLDAHELARHLLAQVDDHGIEQLEGFRLVLVERIALSQAAP